jgi:hypothetical protein
MYADAGGQNKVGEMSKRVNDILFPKGGQEEHSVAFIVFPGSRLHPAQNRPEGEIRTRLQDLSRAANINMIIELMASGLPFKGLPASEAWYSQTWRKPNAPPAQSVNELWHRSPDLDLLTGSNARDAGRVQRITDAPQQFGYDPVVAAQAAQEAAASAERPGLGIQIQPMDLSGLQIPKPPGQ